MANEEIITQFNQLMWQMDQLRNEANEAGITYATKLKTISKRMSRINERIEILNKEMARRAQVQPARYLPPVGNASDAGFHPQS